MYSMDSEELTNATAKYVVPEADTYDSASSLRVADESGCWWGIWVVFGRYIHEGAYIKKQTCNG